MQHNTQLITHSFSTLPNVSKALNSVLKAHVEAFCVKR